MGTYIFPIPDAEGVQYRWLFAPGSCPGKGGEWYFRSSQLREELN